MAAYAYGIAARQVGYGNDLTGALILAALVGLHLLTGFTAARWWIVVMPIVAVLVALPADYAPYPRGEPFPIWFGLAVIVAPGGIILAAVGVAAAHAVKRRPPD